MKTGTLYLIPSFLAETNDGRNFPVVNLDIVSGIDQFIVENLRTARRFLRKIGYTQPFETVEFYELNKHTDPTQVTGFLKPAEGGVDVGLISEAGVPCVADPGSEIVQQAHEKGIRVVPLTGPSSIILALMASGFNGQSFQFHGYLPIDRKERDRKIREIEHEAKQNRQTQIFIETPYRNNPLLEALLSNCSDQSLLCIASMITHETLEFIQTKTIGKWKKGRPDLHKKPVVFLLF